MAIRSTPLQHFQHLLQLLKIERIEDRKQYEQKIRNRSLEERKKQGVCWYPVVIDRSELGVGEKWVLRVNRTTDLGKRHMFQVGASASLFLQTRKDLSVTGIISRVGEDKLTLVLNSDTPPDWVDDGKLGVDLLFDESTYDEMEKNIRKLSKVENGRLSELIALFLGQGSPQFTPIDNIHFPALNDSQSGAIGLIESARDVALIHGPPGTGKTTTMVQAIKEVVAKEKQVMVCAPSNAAVDLLVERLHTLKVKVVRLGHPARVTEEVVSHTLDAQLAAHPDAKMLKDIRKQSEEMRRMGWKYKRNYGRSERLQRKLLIDEANKLKNDALALEDHMIHDILNEAEVIASTLIGSNHHYLGKRSFKTVFIDEASQALEPANWIPIMRAGRVIMAGDHQQLPPTVKSKVAAKEGLEETLFERVMRSYQADTMLQIQYRMDPAIKAFSNEYFYQSQLKSSESVLSRKQLFSPPVVFIDTAGCGFEEEVNAETLSTFNKEEALFTLDHLNKRYEEDRAKLEGCSIGIIAPYKAQVEVLRRSIHNYDWSVAFKAQITINSVDAFQGQERDVMYISLVRSNDKGEIGFLADIRRINVAMTRARHLLHVIGDSATLSTHGFFDQMIRHFQEKGYYHSAFEFIY
ncbi:MAG: AAA family ATPase [Cyclobacteriaceae bacterium]|nr:AAA family ATPase [Cyclobacteriaceae bacterium HetDA_MAG_MS6]